MPQRIASVDAVRGLAVIAMVAFHFAFDLAYFRITTSNFYQDAFWLNARTAILSSFLLLAGVSLALAQSTPTGRGRFWLHVARIAGCALAVTLGSLVIFPNSFIWFGVLHAIALSLVLIRPLAARPWVALVLGIAVIAAGNLVSAPMFDDRPLGWIGFATRKPVTEDYVPLFPWMGVMLIGLWLGRLLARNRFAEIAAFAHLPRVVPFLGRHSLVVYMVHQPILIGVLYLFVQAR